MNRVHDPIIFQHALDGIDLKAIKRVKEIVDGLIQNATVDKKAYDGLSPEIRARLVKLDELEDEERRKAEAQKQSEIVKSAVAEAIKPLQDELAELKKTKGVSKGVKGQDADKGDKTEPDVKWPSLSRQE